MSISNEQLDEAGNPIRVADLTFTEQILGAGAYGTVYLARRHPSCSTDAASVATDPSEGSCSNKGYVNGSVISSALSTPNSPVPSTTGHHRRKSSQDPLPPAPFWTPQQRSTRRHHTRIVSGILPGIPPASPTPHQQLQQQQNPVRLGYLPQSRRESGGSMARSNSAPAGGDFFVHGMSGTHTPISNNNSCNSNNSSFIVHSPIVQKVQLKFNAIFRSDSWQNNNNSHHHTPIHLNPRRSWSRKSSTNSCESGDNDDDDDQLVAVKIFRKSVLKRKRTMERDKETRRMLVTTALDRVEQEIALMKKLAHPNLVEFYEAIDSPDSDVLYLVSAVVYLFAFGGGCDDVTIVYTGIGSNQDNQKSSLGFTYVVVFPIPFFVH